jgi:2-dehydro-3-deoxyphosphogluconate aldolase/(4S)-4-hydroxy-2-oxoglutarate aldolase
VDKEKVLAKITEMGIIPAVRVPRAEDALFAAEAVYRAGIPVVEITMTIPDALSVIERLTRTAPDMVVGAGSVLDTDTAQRCLDAGASFLTSTGLDLEIIELALRNNIAYFPGGLTPTEIIMAWKAGSDFVKVFPCAQVGGDHYIKALKAPLPQVPLIAAGGVNQTTAAGFISAGAVAIGVGAELIPHEAIQMRKHDQVVELARRFKRLVNHARGFS